MRIEPLSTEAVNNFCKRDRFSINFEDGTSYFTFSLYILDIDKGRDMGCQSHWIRPGLPFESYVLDEILEKQGLVSLKEDVARGLLSNAPAGIFTLDTECAKPDLDIMEASLRELHSRLDSEISILFYPCWSDIFRGIPIFEYEQYQILNSLGIYDKNGALGFRLMASNYCDD